MSAVDLTYRPPPISRRGVVGWARANLFATPLDIALTFAGLLVIGWAVPPIIDYLFLSAFWTGTGAEACSDHTGFCWPLVNARMGQFIYGSYPDIERWRVNLVGLLAIALVAPMFIKGFKHRRLFAALLIGAWPIVSGLLLSGGVLGLEPVGTQLWGGFLVTLVVAVVGIAASLPIGIALALARRSSLPLIRWLAIAVIEGIRGAPLITILFMASLMLPLFLPAGMTINGLLRVLVGFSLFAGAYVAEVVRAGLSALPKGQMEAASALGLGYWQTHGLILLPQALRMVIPGIVNTFIALFKDTTLVTIVGIMDLLGAVQAANNDPFWAGPNTQPTGYVVVGVMFWLSCYALSRFSSRLERQLNQNQRRI